MCVLPNQNGDDNMLMTSDPIEMTEGEAVEYIALGLTPRKIEKAYANRDITGLVMEFKVKRTEILKLARRWGIKPEKGATDAD